MTLLRLALRNLLNQGWLLIDRQLDELPADHVAPESVGAHPHIVLCETVLGGGSEQKERCGASACFVKDQVLFPVGEGCSRASSLKGIG